MYEPSYDMKSDESNKPEGYEEYSDREEHIVIVKG